MPKAKKFGAFAGVFTPSILTILGVIMYLRLGWVVGEAGLIAALGIIIISHIISITTGLSISSIATDKRIKAGGIYYILSRSLGLPMGGSIGIALFVGTALSCSLYIVGFSESFLALETVQNYLGLENNVNSIRIVGTVVIITLVVIAFISTSLAIKTQFFILSAIFLSLISIGLGFVFNADLAPEQVLLKPYKEGVAIEKVFAVFFPAVTGFTAGVAMSGDLKDPKKTIPFGTMAAIGVGFVVYIVLAIGFGFFVNRDLLTGGSDFLLTVALYAPLVIAGIWGATLSSALGGILGAPRILQAVAFDKIMPRFLAKGYGPSNEPRNALLITFIIAELGILIGELNAIAGIVSMFYLASYGFINIAFTLESWASTDFRPSFRVPKIVGIIGFTACFGVMFKLDMVSMFIALIIMGSIYFILMRRQIRLDFGDVWQSVWSSVVRNALHRMSRKPIEQRNWQPNIILFSGGTQKRPHLLEFGKFLVGNHGMLSNFELLEREETKDVYPKYMQSVINQDDNIGVFTRKHVCKDIYEGIKTISATYGFSGVEPNTILLGWAGETNKPEKFVKTLNYVSKLDLNVLLIDYDRRYGFGEHKLIDIWWRGAGNNGNLALMLSKFICSSDEWSEAKVRLLVVSYEPDENERIYKKAEQIFDSLRFSRADIKIINNHIEKRSFYDIIRIESVHTDLIFLGIPPSIPEGKELQFIDNTNRLMRDIGSVVLLRASSYFKRLSFAAGLELTKIKKEELKKTSRTFLEKDIEIEPVSLPSNHIISNKLETLHQNMNKLKDKFHSACFLPIIEPRYTLSNSLLKIVNKNFLSIERKVSKASLEFQRKTLPGVLHNTIQQSKKALAQYQETSLNAQKITIEKNTRELVYNLDKTIDELEKYLVENYTLKDLEKTSDDDKSLIRFKFWNRLKIKLLGRPIEYKNRYRDIVKSYLPIEVYQTLLDVFQEWGDISLQYVVDIQKLITSAKDSLIIMESKIDTRGLSPELVSSERSKNEEIVQHIDTLSTGIRISLYRFFSKKTNEIIQNISDDIKRLDVNKRIRRVKKIRRRNRQLRIKLLQIHQKWYDNQMLLFDEAILEMRLFTFENELRKTMRTARSSITSIFSECTYDYLNQLDDYFNRFYTDYEKNGNTEFAPPKCTKQSSQDEIFMSFRNLLEGVFRDIKQAVTHFPETIDIFPEEVINEYKNIQYDNPDVIAIEVQKLLNYLIREELFEPLQQQFNKMAVQLHQLNTSAIEIVRYTAFGLLEIDEYENNKPNNSKPVAESVSNLDFISEQKNKVDTIHSDVKKLNEDAELLIIKQLNDVSDKLSLFAFKKLAANVKQYIHEHEARKRFDGLRRIYSKSWQSLQNLISRIWFRKSNAMLLARNFGQIPTKSTIVNRLLNLVEKISPNEEIVRKLPFYYQQLFLRKHNYYSDFWVGRKPELQRIQKAVERFKKGYKGAVVVTGEHNSGKTFLCRYVNTYFKDFKIYHILATETGSIDKLVFKAHLEQAVKQTGASCDKILQQLQQPAVLIIDELEMWWEKSANGLQVVQIIIELLEKYGDRHLFVFNVNSHTFNIIDKISTINRYCLDIIDCKPFTTEQLKDAIIARHQSSGLKFELLYKHRRNKHQDNFRTLDYAGLFSKYFNYSFGNIGSALLTWVANIKHFNNNLLQISAPKTPDISILDELQPDISLFILQFILHKRLTIERLHRITLTDKEAIIEKINFLSRSGIIVEIKPGIFTFNEYLLIYIIEKLMEKELI